MRHPRLRLALAISLALAQSSRTELATAQTKTALSWVREQGAEACIGPAELGRRVEQLVGPVLAAAPEGQISIEGAIKRAGSGFAANVAVSDARGRLLGRRELRSSDPNCRALDDQLAFIIAVAIDPNAALAELPGELSADEKPEAQLLSELDAHPPQPAALPARTKARTPPDARVSDAGASTPPARFSAMLGAGGSLGMLPRASADLAADFGLRTGVFSHHVRGRLSFGQGQTLQPGKSVALDALEAALASCLDLLAVAGFQLAPCAGVAGANLSAAPRGFAGATRARWLVGPLLSARVGRPLPEPLAVVFELGAQSLWPRTRFEYELSGKPQLIRRLPAIEGFLTLGLELRF